MYGIMKQHTYISGRDVRSLSEYDDDVKVILNDKHDNEMVETAKREEIHVTEVAI